MARSVVRIAIASTFLFAATAAAQTTTPTSWKLAPGLGIGGTVPIGDLADFTNIGYHLQGILEFTPPPVPIPMRFDLMYHKLSGKDISTGLGTSIQGPDARVIAGTLDAVWRLPRSNITPYGSTTTVHNPNGPYLRGGIGLYNLDVGDSDNGGSGSTTSFGLNIAGGINYQLSGLRTFAELGFHNLFTTGGSTRLIPITVGVMFGGM